MTYTHDGERASWFGGEGALPYTGEGCGYRGRITTGGFFLDDRPHPDDQEILGWVYEQESTVWVVSLAQRDQEYPDLDTAIAATILKMS